MKIVRLQLAMERRDRQVALQAVDDLMMLDGKIRDFLNHIPIYGSGIASMQQEIEDQRGWLVREKFTLGAGMSKSLGSAEKRRCTEPEPTHDGLAGPEASGAHQLEQHSSDPFSQAREKAAPVQPVSSRFWIGILLLFVIIVACAGFIFGTGGWEDFITLVPRVQGGS